MGPVPQARQNFWRCIRHYGATPAEPVEKDTLHQPQGKKPQIIKKLGPSIRNTDHRRRGFRASRPTVIIKKEINGTVAMQNNGDELDVAAEAELFELLDLDPRISDSKDLFKLNERSIVTMTRLNGAAFQKMYKIKGYWVDQDKKSYPLKAVCSLGASLDTIKAVYKLNPEAAFEALCECSFSKYPLEVVKFLVDSNPKALDQVDEAGRTVLHYSSTCNSVSKDVIKYIVSKNESRLLAKTTKGSTPLHLACGHLLSLKNLRHFVDSNGDVLKVKNNEGRTPLYIACCEKTPVEVIQYFTECCPLSLEMADMDGFLPLHGACCSAEPSMEIIEYLVTKNTRSLTMKAAEAGNGRTPLHLVAAQAGRSQLVKFLVDKNPSMLLVPDNDGLLPVHVACALADLETVKLLLNVRPDAMRLKSTDNLTPFTVACVSENMPVVTYMAEAFPDLMRLKGEEDGWYPLHHACSEGKTVVLDYLLEKYPDAALEVDRKGRSPLALIARRADCEIKIIQKLVGLHFDTIKILDYAGNPPLSHDQKDALIVSFLESRSPLS